MTVARKPVPRRRSSAGASKPKRKANDREGSEQAALILWLFGQKMRGEPVGVLFGAIYHRRMAGSETPGKPHDSSGKV